MPVTRANETGTRPKVSVIMPSYNGVRFVSQSLQSLLQQTFTDFEIVVVDDGSAQPTRDVLHAVAKTDSRIRLHFSEHAGLVATLNKALALARGHLVARLDHDDISLPTRLARQVAFLDANPNFVAVGCDIALIDAEGRLIKLPKKRNMAEPHSPTAFPPKPMWMPGPTVMARTTVIRDIGGFREKMFAAEDRDICWRLGAAGPTHRILEPLVEWRSHGENTSVTKYQTQMASHALGDLSAIARHFGLDDSAILEQVVVGGDYLPTIARYQELIGARYPVETYWYFFLMRYRAWQLSGEATDAALLRRVYAHCRANPFDWRRWRLARRAYMFARRKHDAPQIPKAQDQ